MSDYLFVAQNLAKLIDLYLRDTKMCNLQRELVVVISIGTIS